MPENLTDGLRYPAHRAAHCVTDPHHALRDIATGQRFLDVVPAYRHNPNLENEPFLPLPFGSVILGG